MINQELFLELLIYVDRHFEEMLFCSNEIDHIEIEEFITQKHKPTFKELLFNFIDEKNVSDPFIYKRAGIDRKHFSKIRSNPNYLPKKNTIIALSLALELNKMDMEELLNAAGFALSNSDKNDLVIRFCVEKKLYDIDFINEALNQLNLSPLIK
ncbi:hypothetical protein [Bacillus sp. AFS017336]|uniref:hypothetical protein n=1 Tax=Bacillus sp. AFS017336 TaxID=2033489 RepID=UPI000BF1C03D|nr:hypothetical protein [Bacillus sp. AFS017336]PEL08359.1 hypothetical protein CN601_17235 [Bacillus sp. AFS017336]